MTSRSKQGYWYVRHRKTLILAAVLTWLLIICFSSTSLAGRWSEHSFRNISVLLRCYLQTNAETHAFHLLAEKGVHVCLFTILGLLLWTALPRAYRNLGCIVLAGALIGSGSEFLQSFFPGRDPALRDVCLNAAATTLGGLIGLLLIRIKQQQTVKTVS